MTLKADLLHIDPAQTSQTAATVSAAATTAAGNVSVQGKKEEVKPAQIQQS